MNILSIPFTQDIISAALELVCDHSIMVFPTRASAAIAQKEFQPKWQLEEVTWTTMEEFKNSMWVVDRPLMQDDKRLLSLYQVMTDEDKEYFHLLSYSDLVDWGNHFFQFFEELGEAGHKPEYLDNIMQEGILYLRYWQEEYMQKVAAICVRYREFIQSLGFTDHIFITGESLSDIPITGARIVFVNQYYYSALERDLIHKLEQQQNHIYVLYHGVEMIAQDLWEPQELDLAAALQSLPHSPKIRLVECENETQAALSFLNSNQNLTVSDSAIVDANFHQKSYQAFFDPARFSIPCSLDITATRYYSFILVLHKLVQAVNSTAGYIPLRLIIQNFLDAGLLSVLCPQWDDTAHACFKEELFKLSADEVLYLDIQPQNQLARMPYTLDMIEKLRALITEISGINTIAGLLSLLAREQPLAPERICTPEELEYTDIRPKLWEAAANFSTAETLGIVQNWSVILPPAELAEGILRLWLDFIKPIRLSRMLLNPVQPAWEIINLLDSRNRKYVTLAFFNMVENVLPSSPSPVWLLNESQRGLIGLKTYKDIRGWERYYFFRLLLCAQEVQIYTHRNLDKNIEPSSFIGELLEICAQLGHPIPSEKVHYSLPELFRVWRNAPESDSGLNLTTSNICCHERTLSPEFFILPPDPTRDFPASHEIVCNSYSLYMFTKNPFAWYIQNLRKLTPLKAELIETISPTLFGNIMHEYFARILRPHAGIHQDLNALAEVFQDTPFLRKSLEDTLASPAFNCKIPKNYNAEFLSSIISACLVDTLGAFYSGFILKRLKGQRFRLIPEEKRSTIEELTPKQLTTAERDGATYRLSIKGRADLRIETEKHKLIIDFKTGGASVEQLIFYEWFYYLIDAPDSADELESLFWLIFDKTRGKEFTDSKKRAKYYDVIHNSLIQCLEKGYQQGIRAEDRKWLKEITRADLQTVGVEDAKI